MDSELKNQISFWLSSPGLFVGTANYPLSIESLNDAAYSLNCLNLDLKSQKRNDTSLVTYCYGLWLGYKVSEKDEKLVINIYFVMLLASYIKGLNRIIFILKIIIFTPIEWAAICNSWSNLQKIILWFTHFEGICTFQLVDVCLKNLN
uniref:Uncharacterized protein n=1 Tax=Glossina brevipalpis TaxID=37001 RepID=A0A1A9WT02_9MUSC